ncbi:MAG: WecB/TagA/CpsF family glycosyltransferase, partial [Chlamydiia bacterium]|nr:WecB/TagA/CpsF family glycosyltransferase [Chlamydiia bacterium]
GDTKKITQATVPQLSRDLPNLKIAGALSPQIDPQETPDIVQKINKAKPHLLFLQLGSPKQELWFAHNRHLLNVPVTIGIGGAFERYCGHTKRAPLWMQRSGLEWLFRLTQEPQRLFPRYLKDALTFTTHCLQWLPIHFLFSHPSSLQHKAAKIYDLQSK